MEIERLKIKNYRRFRDVEVSFNSGLNLLVGGNEAGKTTLLEAISLAVTGRVRGRWAGEDLHPFWFNKGVVHEYFQSYKEDPSTPTPEIDIELYIKSSDPNIIRQLQGTNNSERLDCPGLRVQVCLDRDYLEEFSTYMGDSEVPEILPTDYFTVHWHTFASEDQLRRKPHGLSLAQVDNRTISSNGSIDYYTRQLLLDQVDPMTRAQLSTKLRVTLAQLSGEYLDRINGELESAGDVPETISVELDQTSSSSWESTISPHMDGVPLPLSGQAQQAFAKIELAMLNNAQSEGVVLVEEPENHMSHTRLRQLIDRLEALAHGRQLIVSTHNSFVLNRLGLDRMRFLHEGRTSSFDSLSPSDVSFFKKLPNYDTLRLILADKVVLVEGPSDQVYLEAAFQKLKGCTAASRGVDIIAIDGTAFARWFALGQSLGKTVLGVRDNDGKEPGHWRTKYNSSIGTNSALFVGERLGGRTLEPQIVNANNGDLKALAGVLGVSSESTADELIEWMISNKTDSALALASTEEVLMFPRYIREVVESAHG